MTLVAQKNTGNVGYNFNVAINRARGEIISFMSLDDVIHSDQIKKCVDKFITNPNLMFVAPSKILAVYEKGYDINKVADLRLDSLENITIDDLLELEYREFGAFYIQGTFFRRDIINKIGGFDEDMTGDDIVLRTKIFRYMKKHKELLFEIIKEPTCYYRRHGGNISNNISRQIKIVTEYLQRYWGDRKNPELLTILAGYAIRRLDFKEAWNMIFMNDRSRMLLKNINILRLLVKNLFKTCWRTIV